MKLKNPPKPINIADKDKIQRAIEQLVFYSPDGCWYWLGYVANDGYARYGYGHKVASRVSYQVFKGPIPEGLCICHTCDNPLCVNPDHLWAGTRKENMVDMVKKGRNGIKLTKDDVLAIRASTLSAVKLAGVYRVSSKNINYIRNRQTWKNVPLPEVPSTP